MGGDKCDGSVDTVETSYHQEERIPDVLQEDEKHQKSTICSSVNRYVHVLNI